MDESKLTDQARQFAEEVQDLLARTVCPSVELDLQEAPTARGLSVVIRITKRESNGRRSCYLTVENIPLLELEISYRIFLERKLRYLRVEESHFQIQTTKGRPLFRYDYVSHPESPAIPVAHIQIHAHRDELLHAMYVSNKSRSKRSKKKDLDPASPRGLHMIHFPLGGARFRPCLEDVIELVIHEFGVDAQPGWEECVASGRIAWRHIQLAAAVRDDPDTARRTLEALDKESNATNEKQLSRF